MPLANPPGNYYSNGKNEAIERRKRLLNCVRSYYGGSRTKNPPLQRRNKYHSEAELWSSVTPLHANASLMAVEEEFDIVNAWLTSWHRNHVVGSSRVHLSAIHYGHPAKEQDIVERDYRTRKPAIQFGSGGISGLN